MAILALGQVILAEIKKMISRPVVSCDELCYVVWLWKVSQLFALDTMCTFQLSNTYQVIISSN